MLMYPILFIVGLIEELTAMTYYLVGRQGHKIYCSFLAGMRILIWVFITYSIFKNIQNIYPIFLPYMFGAMCGNFLSLTFEPQLLKYILKLKKRRGRRQKRWWLWSYRNK